MRKELEFTLKMNSDSTMLLKGRIKRRRSHYRHRRQAIWITVIVLGSLLLTGAIVLASSDNYGWLLKE
jgi:hypothetical protein